MTYHTNPAKTRKTPTVVENHNKNNIEILPQHRIHPNKSPINLIPFPTAIHHARENNAQLISTENQRSFCYHCLIVV
jgi:hypothetical protein